MLDIRFNYVEDYIIYHTKPLRKIFLLINILAMKTKTEPAVLVMPVK